MTRPIISIENLSKAYRIGLKEESPDTLAGAMAGAFKAPFKNWKKLQSLDMRHGGEAEDILWALKDVSFDVQRGEVVGIIGRNGAGKSTLLKILSRITEPTSGCVKLRGRVSSLLEVGTGFHPELTGRDNVYMNGTILGMTKREIDSKFDEIVDFSGVEKFLDTPIKRYSSGMKVRLAFAVAAHLEPEILIIDEVLAVGDAEFQRKCLGKMQDVATAGRTVLFVSHNMAAVGTLCPRGILVQQGKVTIDGDVGEVLSSYSVSNQSSNSVGPRCDDESRGFTLNSDSRMIQIECGNGFTISLQIECPQFLRNATIGVVIKSNNDVAVLGASSKFQGISGNGESTKWEFTCDFSNLKLTPGIYRASIWIGNAARDEARFTDAFVIDVLDRDPFGYGKSIPASWGNMFWLPDWTINKN